jgi:hypothetical protein
MPCFRTGPQWWIGAIQLVPKLYFDVVKSHRLRCTVSNWSRDWLIVPLIKWKKNRDVQQNDEGPILGRRQQQALAHLISCVSSDIPMDFVFAKRSQFEHLQLFFPLLCNKTIYRTSLTLISWCHYFSSFFNEWIWSWFCTCWQHVTLAPKRMWIPLVYKSNTFKFN